MPARRAQIERNTTETRIRLDLTIDGRGQSTIATKIPFFDHMLTLFARHSLCDLQIEADGDIEVDLVAAIELTHALLPGMIEQQRGAICFVTSIAGRTGVAGEAVYSATKAGLDAFAESLRAETVGSGVNISVVVPGVVDTGFFETRGRPYDRERPRRIPAGQVADAVVRTVVRDRAEAWAPRWLRIAPTLRALAPGTFRRLASRFGEPVRSR